MRRSCCLRAIGKSVPSSESRTLRRCCRSPKTICEVRETAPFSFSLYCTKSERRMIWLLHTDSPALFEESVISVSISIPPHGNYPCLWLLRIMVWGGDRVKFGGGLVCPK